MNINVTLTNRSARIPLIDTETFDKLRAFWSFSPKGLWFMPQYKPTKMMLGQKKETLRLLERLRRQRQSKKIKSRITVITAGLAALEEKLAAAWDGRISMVKDSALSAGLFRATWREAEKACGVTFTAVKERETVVFVPGLPDAGELYRHQDDCVRAMLYAIPKGGGIALAATRSGKTSIAARMFSKVQADCLFVVDQLDLLYQQQDELHSWLQTEKIGVVGESRFEPERVTVATIQTLHRHYKRADFRRWFRGVDIVVVDELHEQMARRNFSVLQSIDPLAVFGLTATLQLTQKETCMKAYAFAGPVIFRFPIVEGVKRGVLAKGYALQLLFNPKANYDPEIDGKMDYEEELALEVTQNDLKLSACRAITEELVLRLNRHEVIFTERVSHLQDVDNVLSGIRHGLAYGDIDVSERTEAKELFEDEDIKLIIANRVFKKGVTLKRVDAMIDLAEGKSKNDAVQKFGRMLGLHKDKMEGIYIDFGTAGSGRFAAKATSRRRALKKAGIGVTVVNHVSSEAEAVAAVRKFIKKVTHGRSTGSSTVDR